MAPQTFSVSDLLSSVDAALRVCFPDEVWVEGEISALKAVALDPSDPRGGRHIFFNLVDPETAGLAGSQRPVLPVKLFDSQRQRVNAYLRRYGSVKMTDGVRVRISGRLQFYPARSQVDLQMNLLDPAYTLALLATERDRVLRALAADGLLERNQQLALPAVPLELGVITSSGSAAEADFLHELRGSGFGWRVSLAHSRVQGPTAESSLVAAIDALAARDVDVIAIVRGGGAKTELATFDGEPLARAIATAPVPVFTGIGHEVDDSVADRVAHTARKTPTACAAALVEHVRRYVESVESTWDEIRRSAGHATVRTTHHLERSAGSVEARSRLQVNRARHRLDDSSARVPVATRRALTAGTQTLAHLEARVQAHDPVRALARGWTITRTEDGRTLRSATQVRAGERLVTTLADGDVSSVVAAPETTS